MSKMTHDIAIDLGA